jgi:hypothetical protein
MASLIICLDGTWNNADSADFQTNIGLLASMIDPKPERGVPAQIYYDAGVGTSGSRTNRLAGGLLGKGLSTNILEAYRFLSLNYQPGDDIYIFGYSRAPTRRAAVRLPGGQWPAARGRLRSAEPGLRLAVLPHQAQEALSGRQGAPAPSRPRHVRVRFLGVFDTVGSLGIPRTWLNWIGRRAFQFHDTDLCAIVDYACQALAIDEHRIEFEAAVWRQPQHRGYRAVEQVWFPGVHANIGGGYEDRGLSDLTLDWMIKRLRKYCPEVVVSTAGLQPNHRGTLYDPRSWLYWRSIWRPLMRLINRCVLKDCRRIRLASIAPHSKPIGEMLHWSALARFMETKKAGSAKRYAPANLRAALDSVREGKTLIVGADGEPGSFLPAKGPSAPTRPAAQPTVGEMRLH